MSSRLLFCWSVLVGGVVFWSAMSCGPSVDEKTVTEEASVIGDVRSGFARKDRPGENPCKGEEHGLHYVSRDPEECLASLFTCPGRQEPFFNDCGCGCQSKGGRCDYSDPTRIYISRDPDQCALIDFICDPGFTHFFDACGCGCEQSP